MIEWLLLLLGVVLTFGTALFVAAEFSFVALDRPTVEKAVERGDRGAHGVLSAIRSLSTQLSGAQVGITITTLLVGFLVEPSLASLLETPLTGLGMSETTVAPVSVAVALLLATAFSMVFGELVPKNLAISVPLRTASAVAPLHRGFTAAIAIPLRLLNASADRVLRIFGVTPQEELSSGRSAAELASLVRHSAEAGTLDEQTATRLTRSLGFSTRTAADVMTPRVRMISLHHDQSASDVVRLARKTGHSRFPVIEQDRDDVVGIVHLKTAVSVPRDRREGVPVTALMSDPLRVPETVRLDPLLVELRSQGLQLALVVDEYGGTAGVVTLEDVVEELVGDVADEHDRSRGGVVARRDGSWIVPGLIRPDELRDQLHVDMPDGRVYETAGGYVMAELGRVPVVGDEVLVDGARIVVERMEGRRIDRLGVRRVPQLPVSDPQGDEAREQAGDHSRPEHGRHVRNGDGSEAGSGDGARQAGGSHR